jgi:Holliday junction resolvase RusA-like endonuclease
MLEKKMQIVFYGRVPSKKNGKTWIRRGSRKFLVPSQEYTNWEKSEVARLKALHGSPMLDKYSLELSIFLPSTSVRDVDNILTSVQDCLKAAEIIKDDRWTMMVHPPRLNQPIVDKMNPRVEVTVSY